jgi:hypothetical protein
MIRSWTKRVAQSMPGGFIYTCPTSDGFMLRACPMLENGRWHMSLSVGGANGISRFPTWDEIADARDDLLPAKLDFVMILPPKWDYLNLHDVFHLHEVHDDGLCISRGTNMPRTHESGLVIQ